LLCVPTDLGAVVAAEGVHAQQSERRPFGRTSLPSCPASDALLRPVSEWLGYNARALGSAQRFADRKATSNCGRRKVDRWRLEMAALSFFKILLFRSAVGALKHQ